jgi:hypothetical protein
MTMMLHTCCTASSVAEVSRRSHHSLLGLAPCTCHCNDFRVRLGSDNASFAPCTLRMPPCLQTARVARSATPSTSASSAQSRCKLEQCLAHKHVAVAHTLQHDAHQFLVKCVDAIVVCGPASCAHFSFVHDGSAHAAGARPEEHEGPLRVEAPKGVAPVLLTLHTATPALRNITTLPCQAIRVLDLLHLLTTLADNARQPSYLQTGL